MHERSNMNRDKVLRLYDWLVTKHHDGAIWYGLSFSSVIHIVDFLRRRREFLKTKVGLSPNCRPNFNEVTIRARPCLNDQPLVIFSMFKIRCCRRSCQHLFCIKSITEFNNSNTVYHVCTCTIIFPLSKQSCERRRTNFGLRRTLCSLKSTRQTVKTTLEQGVAFELAKSDNVVKI